jgi:undecaprenyl pyrophosphate phosphatase UppP
VTLLAAALLGIVQGITEFLPVSSTAHLLLIGNAIGYEDPGGVFTVMIQLGSILAVVWVYRLKILRVISSLRTRAESRRFAAAEFSFFLAIPTMSAAFLHDLLQVSDQLSPSRSLEIGVGLATAFLSSFIVIKPFLAFVARAGFARFAWYRIALGVGLLAAMGAGWVRA